MVRHDPKPVFADELWSLQELTASESPTQTERLRAQMQISERLIEYCIETVAELRASLDRTEHEG